MKDPGNGETAIKVATINRNLALGTVEYFIPMANTGPRGGSHHQLEGMFKTAFNGACRPAEIEGFHSHDFRHTAVTNMRRGN